MLIDYLFELIEQKLRSFEGFVVVLVEELLFLLFSLVEELSYALYFFSPLLFFLALHPVLLLD